MKERERKEAEEGDEMKKLENKTKASKREMDLNAALEEMKSLSARHGRMDLDGVVASVEDGFCVIAWEDGEESPLTESAVQKFLV